MTSSKPKIIGQIRTALRLRHYSTVTQKKLHRPDTAIQETPYEGNRGPTFAAIHRPPSLRNPITRSLVLPKKKAAIDEFDARNWDTIAGTVCGGKVYDVTLVYSDGCFSGVCSYAEGMDCEHCACLAYAVLANCPDDDFEPQNSLMPSSQEKKIKSHFRRQR